VTSMTIDAQESSSCRCAGSCRCSFLHRVDPASAVLADAFVQIDAGHPFHAEEVVWKASASEIVGARGLARIRSALGEEWRRGIHWEYPGSHVERQAILGKGIGLVAKHDIEAGTTILFDTPFWSSLIYPDVPEGNGDEAEAQLRQDWKLKPGDADEARLERIADVLTMAGAEEARQKGGGLVAILRSVLEYNAVEVSRLQEHLALFPVFSRLNHSCEPNCMWHADESSLCVRTIVDVKTGEELTHCYLRVLMLGPGAAKARRHILKTSWGFECDCRACPPGS